MAMNAYRNYNTNTKALSGNLEKLSSGYKINRAGDDAAGLAISEKMRAQITGLNAAQKNVKDGISLVKTAEGAMQEIQDMLNRMDYLATQSANGTYDNEVDRANLQKEVDALKTEINRIADSANFNGIKLLDGSQDASFKTTNASDVKVTVVEDGQLGKETQAGKYSIDFSNTTITAKEDNASVTLTLFGNNPMEVTLSKSGDKLQGADLAQAFADEWNKQANQYTDLWADSHGFNMTASVEGDKLVFTMDKAPTAAWTQAATTGKLTYTDSNGNNAQEITVTTEQEAVDTTNVRLYGQASFGLVAPGNAADGKIEVVDGGALTIGDETYVFAVGANSKYKGLANVIDLTDKTTDSADLAKVAGERLTAAAAGNTRFKVGSDRNGTITITEKEGGVDYTKNNLAGPDGKGSGGNGNTVKNATSDDWAGLVKTGMVDSSVLNKGLTLQIGDTADSYNQMKVSVGDMHTKALGIDGINIGNQTGAAAAIDTIRNAINQVSSVRGDLGAIQNRLEHTGNNLSVMAENIQDAESTIRDTDVAEEMMSYVKNNILVQSAQAMLAQANQVPQGVLQLLG
ncbi:flagellin N-terminal helical domain-containing protein [Acutalibacter muris]|uniref:flagellin N-terminal helical domain-containing protein n=1 Tax=Acutalibacter muris TaxID=1796620 RepID=UPI003FA4167F